jgi:DNA-binding NarL/FixJ family response regulator
MSKDFTLQIDVSLLIIDDHALFCEGLMLLFRMFEKMSVLTVAYSEAPAATDKYQPDVIILGLQSKEDSCWPLAESLHKKHTNVGLMILDDFIRTRNIRLALAAGINGYWTKCNKFTEIVSAVRLIAAGERSFCPEVEKYLLRTRRGLRYHPAHTASPIQKLTARELDLLVLLAQGLTVKKCAERMGISVNTVDNHKTRLMRKLGVHKSVELARFAVEEGLILKYTANGQ